MGRSTRAAAPPSEHPEYTSPTGDLRADKVDQKRRIDREKQWKHGSLPKNQNQPSFEPRRPYIPNSFPQDDYLDHKQHRRDRRAIARYILEDLEEIDHDLSKIPSDVCTDRKWHSEQNATPSCCRLPALGTHYANVLNQCEEKLRQREFEWTLKEYVIVDASDIEH